MKIGIMGGTFDPPHLGHILPVAEASVEFHLDQVWFIPNSIPPHKTRLGLTDSFHRAAMVALAIQSYPHFLLNTLELNREAPSYTFDTISELRAGSALGHQVFFILGTDSFLEIDTWRRYVELIEICEFIIINRGNTGEELKNNLERLESALNRKLPSRFHFSRAHQLAVSSTEIRNALDEGRPVSGMVPPEVEQYVLKHSLYTRRKTPSD